MWRFLWRPRWVISHLLVVALVVAMVNLGLWQLRRLDERRDRNALIAGRSAAAPDDVADIVNAVDGGASDSAYRRATAAGTYVAEDEVLVANRSHGGLPGAWVLTPLRLDDGTALVVNRGFVGFGRDGSLVGPDPPEGEVRVEGLLLESQTRGRYGPRDAADGRLTELARADIGRLQQQVGYDLFPVYLQLSSSKPAQGDLPVPLDLPELGEGPHLGYAMQWFIFGSIAIVGYPLVLRRVARQRRDEEGTGGPDDLDRELAELLGDC